MRPLTVEHILDLPRGTGRPRLRRILDQALAAAGSQVPAVVQPAPRWTAAHAGLDRLPAFVDAPAAVQQAVLADLDAALLGEAYHIERSGLCFAARMALEAPTEEERLLYCLFATDEARHLAEITPWVGPTPPPPTAFHRWLAQALATADRPVLVVLIQVVLEGWGLRHYRQLAQDCTDPALRMVLQRVLADEARHHGAGTLLVPDLHLSAAQAEDLRARLRTLLAMVQAGPTALLGALQQHLGLDPTLPVLHAQLGVAHHTATRLRWLHDLLDLPALQPVLAPLVAEGAFTVEPA